MMNFKKWISCQLVSKSYLSARPFSFFDEESPNGDVGSRATMDAVSMARTVSSGAPRSSNNQVTEFPASPQNVTADASHLVQYNDDDNNADPLSKVEALQIKFLRLVHRIGQPPENLVVAQVLYRLQLASMIRAGESDVKRPGLTINKAKAIAVEQEAAGRPPVDFSFKILVLGRTGVGKSATINSIFDEEKAATNAFEPATDSIQEVVGFIKGIKVTVIDTPGLSPAHGNQRRNRELMLAVRSFIRKSPPDIVLYFERLDAINRGYSDYPLLKLITDVFGSSIWFNTMLVMTHSSSPPSEGPDGYPVSFETFVDQRTHLVQRYINQVISNSQLEIPVLLVENHSLCMRNTKGEKVLPNGHVWMSQFLVLCIATKVLGDANSLLKFQDSFQLTPTSTRLPSLPHLLSSLLRTRSSSSGGGFDDEVDELSDSDEDDYDQLPPIRILTKAQFQKLSRAQRNAYLNELDYRETLFLKKQWKEELRSRRESMLPTNGTSVGNDDSENGASQEAVQLSDMTVPPSFDSGCPTYRYRYFLSNDKWLVRPVLDPQGWDHDVGFDGINLEASLDVKKNLQATLAGQVSKDKKEFVIQAESAVKYMEPRGHALLSGIDIQTAGKDLVYTVHGNARFRNFQFNTIGGGLSVTKFGGVHFIGAKLEDSISVGRRFLLALNAGRMGGCGQVAYGGGLEATIRGRDYPVRDDRVVLAATLLSLDKELVLGGSIQSDLRVGRGTKMSVSANLNNRRLGQVCVRTSTSEHVEIALVAVFSLVQALFRRRPTDAVG
ncbi:translocase of chloroplast 90, chloroplastic [Phoenix dactylifera]|uniref:Translocase of chloroplast 90, chloroplastic n=1 Tax=Phoenix dactylifera TaxID=42345 RepID=A0A8B7C006_PHODC|nr:translocase of chloroplast 90, chloroplastic [Phoenix dactylifera]XP_008788810.2 translocase of chloroplast 90, chloroplastic [Phoenix dactylifera]